MSSTEWLQHLSPKQRSEYVDRNVLEGIPYEPDRIWRKTLFSGFEFSAPTLQDSVKRLEKEGQIRIDKMKGRVHYSRLREAQIRSSLADMRSVITKAMLIDIKKGIKEIGKPIHIKDRGVGDMCYYNLIECFKMLRNIYAEIFGFYLEKADLEINISAFGVDITYSLEVRMWENFNAFLELK